jgi:hypothetical protein
VPLAVERSAGVTTTQNSGGTGYVQNPYTYGGGLQDLLQRRGRLLRRTIRAPLGPVGSGIAGTSLGLAASYRCINSKPRKQQSVYDYTHPKYGYSTD